MVLSQNKITGLEEAKQEKTTRITEAETELSKISQMNLDMWEALKMVILMSNLGQRGQEIIQTSKNEIIRKTDDKITKWTEQIDALEVMGINPINYLIFPKIIAMLFYPFVITIAMFTAIFGGYLAMTFAGVTSEAYVTGIQMDFKPFHMFYSYMKTILFAIILATVPAYHGYYMKGGALEVGKASTSSFVWTSIIIIIVNFVITQLLLS